MNALSVTAAGVPASAALTSLTYQSCALPSVGKARIGRVFSSCAWPTCWPKSHFGLPLTPFLVVMMTTPADALDP